MRSIDAAQNALANANYSWFTGEGGLSQVFAAVSALANPGTATPRPTVTPPPTTTTATPPAAKAKAKVKAKAPAGKGVTP